MSKNKKKPIQSAISDKKNTIVPSVEKKIISTDTPATPAFWRAHILPICVLCAVAFGLYLPSIKYEYVLDDKMVITENVFTQRGISSIGDIFGYESFRGYFGEKKNYLEGDRYRPFSIATFAVEQSLLGTVTPEGKSDTSAQKKLQIQKQEAEKTLRPFRHLVNALLYAFTAFLMYRVLFLMFGTESSRLNFQLTTNNQQLITNNQQPTTNNQQPITYNQQPITKWGQTLPFWITLLFIVHPLHVEVVANIKGRDEILALLGELGALYFSFKYFDTRKIKYLVFGFSAFFIGILSKESAITFLAIVPLTIYFFRKITFTDLMTVTAPIALGTVIYLMMRVNAIGYLTDDKVVTEIMNNPFGDMDFGEKYATIFYTLLLYLKLLIFPYPLTHDYYPYQIPKMTWMQVLPIFSLLLHIGLIFLVYRGWKTKKVWAYGIAFYLLAMSIVSNIFVGVGTFMNERFAYHASLGFCIAFCWLVGWLVGNRQSAIVGRQSSAFAGVGVLTLIVCAYAFLTLRREPDWNSGTTLNRSALKNSPNSARANCFYGVSIWEDEYLKIISTGSPEKKQAVLDSMKPFFRRAIEIYPRYGNALKMSAGVAAEQYKLDGKIEPLIAAFDQANRGGSYDDFVLKFSGYLNSTVSQKSDAEKLAVFYTDMITFYKQTQPTSVLPKAYEKLLSDVQSKKF